MKWEKKGLIYQATGEKGWRNNSALQPTPLVLDDKIRVYAGFRDENGISRVGYVDLDSADPSHILKVSEEPVLDIGAPGMFDDNGVVPTCVLKIGDEIYMYYAGYNLGKHVRFLAFTGLAISKDGGDTFVRYKQCPITDRVEGEELFRAIHSVCRYQEKWYVFYGAGNHFVDGEKKTLPVYDIRAMVTEDLRDFTGLRGKTVIPITAGCHRVGRPYVFIENNLFKMFYGYGSEVIPYRLAYAESDDGFQWKEKSIDLSLSNVGWDSEMMAYPAFLNCRSGSYLFYNGNKYGFRGFGYAKLVEEC